MVRHRGSGAGSYLADPTSPSPSHCASIVATSTLRVNPLPTPNDSTCNFLPVHWSSFYPPCLCSVNVQGPLSDLQSPLIPSYSPVSLKPQIHMHSPSLLSRSTIPLWSSPSSPLHAHVHIDPIWRRATCAVYIHSSIKLIRYARLGRRKFFSCDFPGKNGENI